MMSQQKSEENSAMEMHVFYIFKYILDEVQHTFYCSISGPFLGLWPSMLTSQIFRDQKNIFFFVPVQIFLHPKINL